MTGRTTETAGDGRRVTGRSPVTGHRSALFSRVRLVAFDFDGVFTDDAVYVDQNGKETVRCLRKDGMGISLLRDAGIEAVIISTEENPVVSARAKKLKIRCIQGVRDKAVELNRIAVDKGIPLSHVAFVGNDVNDRGCLEVVGLPIIVRDAHPDVLALAKYRTKAKGGQGAVREVCDLIIKARK